MINFQDFKNMVAYTDPYRAYPWRLLGYTNALLRPLQEFIPQPLYQSSLGVMHTYFLTNSYDYASTIDSKNRVSSAVDCYTWHCAASWVGPALIVDNTRRFCARFTSGRAAPILGAYATLAVTGPLVDRLLNWYFYLSNLV